MSTHSEIKNSVKTIEYPTPAVQAKSEASSPIYFSTNKLCFQPGMSLMQELENLLSRSDEPFAEPDAEITSYQLQYETLVRILDQMDDRFFAVMRQGAY